MPRRNSLRSDGCGKNCLLLATAVGRQYADDGTLHTARKTFSLPRIMITFIKLISTIMASDEDDEIAPPRAQAAPSWTGNYS